MSVVQRARASGVQGAHLNSCRVYVFVLGSGPVCTAVTKISIVSCRSFESKLRGRRCPISRILKTWYPSIFKDICSVSRPYPFIFEVLVPFSTLE